MDISAWKQQFQHITPLTVMTWICFIPIFGLFCGYAWQLNTQELSEQERLRREKRELQQENRELERLNQEMEDYFLSLQSKGERTPQNSDDDTTNPVVEVEQGKEQSFVYKVQRGDTMWDIATMYNVSVDDLLRWNNLTKRSRIFPGDELTIILKE